MEPDQLHADPERIVYAGYLPPASCGVVRLGRFFARLHRSEEFLASFADERGVKWLQPASCIHHVVGYSILSQYRQLQKYVVNQLKRPYRVNTELYSTTQIQQYYSTYAPYQTVITGYWGASDSASWGQGMCGKWNTAAHPTRLGAWTFYDMDLTGAELYRAYIDGGMANIGSICSY